jgi:2-isopropylmalate synthase
MEDNVSILDTTLRDGLQGRRVPLEGKLEVFRRLDQAGIDVIEIAAVTSKPEDPEPIRRAAEVIRNATVCILAFPDPSAIERAGQLLGTCGKPRMHVFNSVAVKEGTKASGSEMSSALETIADTVHRARAHTDDVQWAALDASRSDLDFVCRAAEMAITCGARTVNIADTMGLMLPHEFGALVRYVRDHVANIDKASVAVHCHNDLGLATANSLAGIAEGARQVECALNGLGPRGGNTSLQEIVTLFDRRRDAMPEHAGIDPDVLAPIGQLVSRLVEDSVS